MIFKLRGRLHSTASEIDMGLVELGDDGFTQLRAIQLMSATRCAPGTAGPTRAIIHHSKGQHVVDGCDPYLALVDEADVGSGWVELNLFGVLELYVRVEGC